MQIASDSVLGFICFGFSSSCTLLIECVLLILFLYVLDMLFHVENPTRINQTTILSQPVFSKVINKPFNKALKWKNVVLWLEYDIYEYMNLSIF